MTLLTSDPEQRDASVSLGLCIIDLSSALKKQVIVTPHSSQELARRGMNSVGDFSYILQQTSFLMRLVNSSIQISGPNLSINIFFPICSHLNKHSNHFIQYFNYCFLFMSLPECTEKTRKWSSWICPFCMSADRDSVVCGRKSEQKNYPENLHRRK